jgi:pyrroloquinoline quinone biosynthesis protein B
VRIHILGSSAGGGVPQWNCRCANCRAARLRPSLRRTQSSIAVSADNRRWLLINASPDLPSQFAAFSAVTGSGPGQRGTAIEAVVLTDGELDHITGLLSLRENPKLKIACTRSVENLLTHRFPLLPLLRNYCDVRVSALPATIAGLRLRPLDVSSKAPLYAKQKQPGLAIGLRIESKSKRLAYFPALPSITPEVEKFVAGCDCLLVDGTFWSENEMMGLKKRSAKDMGHVPISGDRGSLAWLRNLNIPRKIYIHINNTNPILAPRSRERKAVERAGLEVASDGMDIRL